MKDRLCQYGNCQIETTSVTVNYGSTVPAERPAFCGAVHAALWLLAREGHRPLARELETRFERGNTDPSVVHLPDAVIEGNVVDFKTEEQSRTITCVYYPECAEGKRQCGCLEQAMMR